MILIPCMHEILWTFVQLFLIYFHFLNQIYKWLVPPVLWPVAAKNTKIKLWSYVILSCIRFF